MVRSPRSFDTLEGHIARAPQLVATSFDGSAVTLVVRADQDPPIIDGNSTSTQVTFAPWGEWADGELLGSERVIYSGSVTVAVPRTREEDLSVLTSFSTFATGIGLAAIMGASTDDDAPSAQVLGNLVGQPFFMTGRGGQRWGFGYVADTGDGFVGTVEPGAFTLFDAGCQPDHMAGLRRGNFFIAAATDTCGASTDLSIVAFDDDSVALRHVPGTFDGIEQLYLVPRADGDIWMVYQPTGEPLYADHLDESGASTTDQRVAVIDDPDVAFAARERLAVTGAGEGLAVVYPQSGEDLPPLVLRVLDGFGEVVFEEWLALPGLAPAPSETERMSLLASPDGESMLLAWAQDGFLDETPGTARTYVTRLDCVR
jgi:hypothetical protein